MGLLEISLETADRLYTWGWRLSVFGAVATAIGIALLSWGTTVRDRDTAELRAQVKDLKTPRRITPDQHARLSERLKPFAKTVFDSAAVVGSTEALAFLGQIEDTLIAAGWSQIDWRGSGPLHTRRSRRLSGTITLDGVSVEVKQGPSAARLEAAVIEMKRAFSAEGVNLQVQFRVQPPSKNDDAIHLLVGNKP